MSDTSAEATVYLQNSLRQDSPLSELAVAACRLYGQINDIGANALAPALRAGQFLTWIADRKPTQEWQAANLPERKFPKSTAKLFRYLYGNIDIIDAAKRENPELKLTVTAARNLIRDVRIARGLSKPRSSPRREPPLPSDQQVRRKLENDGVDKFLADLMPAGWPILLSDRIARVNSGHRTVHDRELDRLLRTALAFMCRGDHLSGEAIKSRIALANYLNGAGVDIRKVQTRIDAEDGPGNRRAPLKQGEPVKIPLPLEDDRAPAPRM